MTFSELEKKFQPLIDTIRSKGGHLIFVGGCVRDILRKEEPKDFDAEVYLLPKEELLKILEEVDKVKTIGKKFGVFYLTNQKIEIALPRLEQKIGKGHNDFDISIYPQLSFEEASMRRDLTINSMGWDPETHTLLDPWNGQDALKNKVLRATSVRTFEEDPLRALRVAQFSARFDMQPDRTLRRLCEKQELADLSMDRLLMEIKKLLVLGKKPSNGMRFLRDTNLLRFFAHIYPSDEILEALDKAIYYEDNDFAFMLSLLTIETSFPQIEHFFEIVNLPKETQSVIRFLHSLKATFFHNLETTDEGYAYRDMAARCYANRYMPHKFLTLLTLGLRFEEGFKKADHHKAFDRKKIQPIIRGEHVLKWRPSTPPQAFSKILEECHKIQLKEELYDEAVIWHRWEKDHNNEKKR